MCVHQRKRLKSRLRYWHLANLNYWINFTVWAWKDGFVYKTAYFFPGRVGTKIFRWRLEEFCLRFYKSHSRRSVLSGLTKYNYWFLVKNFRLHGDSFFCFYHFSIESDTSALRSYTNFVRYALLRISGNVLKLPSIILSCILLLVMSLTSFWFFGWNLGCYPSADQIDQYHVLGQIRRAMRRFWIWKKKYQWGKQRELFPGGYSLI